MSPLVFFSFYAGCETNVMSDLPIICQIEMQQYDAWLSKKVEQSKASAEAGNLTPAADVEVQFAARRAATRARLDLSE